MKYRVLVCTKEHSPNDYQRYLSLVGTSVGTTLRFR